MNAAITGLVVALVALAGCGGDSSSEGDPADPVSGLAAHVPADSTLLAVVDVDAARAELGLAADTDALDNEALAGGNALEQPQGKLLVATALGIPPLNSFLQTLEPDPVVEALDGAAISAAASNQGDPEQAVSVIRTTQPFDELAAALEDAGYERDGDELTNPKARVASVADAGDGVFVLAGEGASASELASAPPGGPEGMVELLEREGESVGVATTIPASSGGCVRDFGGRETASGDQGSLRLRVDGTAEASKVTTEALNGSTATPGEPQIDGDVVEIPFTAEPTPGANPITQVIANFTFTQLYDCA